LPQDTPIDWHLETETKTAAEIKSKLELELTAGSKTVYGTEASLKTDIESISDHASPSLRDFAQVPKLGVMEATEIEVPSQISETIPHVLFATTEELPTQPAIQIEIESRSKHKPSNDIADLRKADQSQTQTTSPRVDHRRSRELRSPIATDGIGFLLGFQPWNHRADSR
jgi:hypothetical protein